MKNCNIKALRGRTMILAKLSGPLSKYKTFSSYFKGGESVNTKL